MEWNDNAVEGSSRFLRRVWSYATAQTEKAQTAARFAALKTTDFSKASKTAKALRFEMHSVLKQINFDYERLQFNTVVSGTMKLLNALEAFKPAGEDEELAAVEALGILLRTLYPVCPHLCTSLWMDLKFDAMAGDMLDTAWPEVDAAALQKDEIELMLQINGKLRGSLFVAANADKASIEAAARAHEAFTKLGAEAKKVLVVPGRLVSIVV
jgi:leucyl-tRNA synthetase